VDDLRGNGAVRHAVFGGVLPQVAHQAAERAFAIGEEERRHVFNDASDRALRLNEKRVR
jgi:hypothetical protein